MVLSSETTTLRSSPTHTSAERTLVTAVTDASPALAAAGAAAGGLQSPPEQQPTGLRAAAAGAAAVLLHVGQGDEPASVHARLRALLGCLGEGVQVRRLGRQRTADIIVMFIYLDLTHISLWRVAAQRRVAPIQEWSSDKGSVKNLMPFP